jgi:hypothetical protein
MPQDPGPEFLERARTELLPKLRDTSCTLSILSPGAFDDPKFALELGYSILLGLPLIIVTLHGVEVPAKLAAVADHVIEADLSTPAGEFALQEKIRPILERQLGG